MSGDAHPGGVFHLRKIPPLVITPPGVTAGASVALFQQRQHTAEPLMFCVWCSLALVLARPFGSGDSVTPGLSMQRVSAASENLDGSAIQTAKSFEWPGRLNDGTEFSTTRSGRSSASMAFSYLTNKIGVLDLDRLYGVLDIVVDVHGHLGGGVQRPYHVGPGHRHLCRLHR